MIGILVADDDFHVAKIHTAYVDRRASGATRRSGR